VPSAGVKTVVIGNIVPIIEISRRAASAVLMVADRRISNGTQHAEIAGGVSVPVIELRQAAFFIHIAQIQEQIRVQGSD
jgi:hypothetical protein